MKAQGEQGWPPSPSSCWSLAHPRWVPCPAALLSHDFVPLWAFWKGGREAPKGNTLDLGWGGDPLSTERMGSAMWRDGPGSPQGLGFSCVSGSPQRSAGTWGWGGGDPVTQRGAEAEGGGGASVGAGCRPVGRANHQPGRADNPTCGPTRLERGRGRSSAHGRPPFLCTPAPELGFCFCLALCRRLLLLPRKPSPFPSCQSSAAADCPRASLWT